MKVLVTAAGGNMAREAIPALARAGVHVRGLRATPGSEQRVLDLGAAEVVIGDVRDPAVVSVAMRGMDAVFHVCPGGLAYWEREIGYSVIEAAIAEDLQNVVVSTLMHPIITALLQHETKRDVEERLVSGPVNWTILQPCDYMQTHIPPSTLQTGELLVPYGLNNRQSVVDLADVAAVAVKVLTEGERHVHARYELCGSTHEPREVAETIARVCGREITVKPVTTREFMRAWVSEHADQVNLPRGLDEHREARAFAARVLDHINEWYDAHDYVGNPNVLEWVLGRPPTSLEDFVRRLQHNAELAA